MTVNTYLVHLHDEDQGDDASREDVASVIASVGGFILMATSGGSLIAACDEQHLGRIRSHRAVAFCGGVSLNPNGQAADRLRALFARNVAAQLSSQHTRQMQQTAASTSAPQPRANFPPGYRPLRWQDRFASQ